MTTLSWGLAANIQAHKKLFSLTLHHIDLFQLCHEFILPEMAIITSVVDNFPIEISLSEKCTTYKKPIHIIGY